MIKQRFGLLLLKHPAITAAAYSFEVDMNDVQRISIGLLISLFTFVIGYIYKHTGKTIITPC